MQRRAILTLRSRSALARRKRFQLDEDDGDGAGLPDSHTASEMDSEWISGMAAVALAAGANDTSDDDLVNKEVTIQHKYECKSCEHFQSPNNDFCAQCGVPNFTKPMTSEKKPTNLRVVQERLSITWGSSCLDNKGNAAMKRGRTDIGAGVPDSQRRPAQPCN